MTHSRTRVLRIVALCAMVGGCQSLPPQSLAPATSASSEWQATMAQSSQDASAGRYQAAERVLADFAARYPASNEATESMFWRALYKLDPGNTAAAPRDAMVLLDGYAQAPQAHHRGEGVVLRRVAATLDARVVAAVTAPPVAALARPEDKAKDEELLRLKDELAKTTAELERIKRRLASPKP